MLLRKVQIKLWDVKITVYNIQDYAENKFYLVKSWKFWKKEHIIMSTIEALIETKITALVSKIDSTNDTEDCFSSLWKM